MRAIQYLPLPEGGYQPIVKLRAGKLKDGPAQSQDTFAVVDSDTTRLRLVDARGDTRHQVSLDSFIDDVQTQPGTGNFVVRTLDGIEMVDSASGQKLASITPENLNHQATMKVLSDGRLAVTAADYSDGGQLIMLGPDMTPAWHHETQLLHPSYLELEGGALAVYDGSHLEVRGRNGEERLTSAAMVGQPVRQGRNLAFMETTRRTPVAGRVSEQENSRWFCRFNLDTGELTRHPARDNADTITALPDGNYMVAERAPGSDFALDFHGPDGELQTRVPLPEGFVLYQTDLCADGKTSLVMGTRFDFDQTPLGVDSRVWKLDLATRTMQEVFQHDAPLVVSALSDGSSAVFTREGIHLVESGRQFATNEELLAALPGGVHPLRERMESKAMGYIVGDPEKEGRWDRLFLTVTHDVGLAGAARAVAEPGRPYVTPDFCFNFMLPAVDALPAAVSAALVPTAGDLFDRARPDWLGQDASGVQAANQEGEVKKLSGSFDQVAGLTMDGHKVALAGSARQSMLQWLEPDLLLNSGKFEVGEGVTGLKLSPGGGSAVATTASGQVMHLVPDAPESAPPDEPRPPTSGIQEEADGIRLPGVFIRRHRKS